MALGQQPARAPEGWWQVSKQPARKATPDPLAVASAAIRALGHVPLRQGGQYECWTCAASGMLDGGAMTGSIFEEKCK